ncbi:MAG: flagellar hook-basal body protein [Planctomycetota bacterium]
MNYGFHLSTAGAITGMRRLDTVANNLANSSTVGFKADMLSMVARKPENLEHSGTYADTNALLDQLGGGTLFRPNHIDLSQGTLRQTGGEFDLAIEGGGFFVVEEKGAKSGDLLLTRAGQLTRDRAGNLVMAGSGAALLGADGRPISLTGAGQLRVDGDGRVFEGTDEVGRLRVVVPQDNANLRKEGQAELRLLGGKAADAPAATRVVQGALEESTVDAVLALAELVKVSRGIEFSTRLMQQHDQMTGRLIDTFGRFA